MSKSRWFSPESKALLVVVGRVALAVIAILGGLLAAFDWFWSEGHMSSYGQLRPWPVLIPVVLVAGWFTGRGLRVGERKSSADTSPKGPNL